MSFTINPGNDSGGGGGSRHVRAGRKLLWAAGVDFGTSKAGNDKIDVRFVCVQDPDGGTDVGAQVWETFSLTQRAAWKIEKFAKAVNQMEPISSDDKDAIADMLIARPVWSEVTMETRTNGDERPRPNDYAAYEGEISDSMDAQVREMEAWHIKGKERFGGGAGGGGNARPVGTDDDIPF